MNLRTLETVYITASVDIFYVYPLKDITKDVDEASKKFNCGLNYQKALCNWIQNI